MPTQALTLIKTLPPVWILSHPLVSPMPKPRLDFDERIRRMDEKLMHSLADGTGEFYDKAGAVIAADVPVMFDRDVDNPQDFTSRMTVITVNHSDLPKFDRQGRIQHRGVMWKIDDIASDDGLQLALRVIRS